MPFDIIAFPALVCLIIGFVSGLKTAKNNKQDK